MQKIAFQGAPGAYSNMACRAAFPNDHTLPCETFADAFTAVAEGTADLAMIPVDNTLAGRVADVHRLMPQAGLKIIGEHFQPIEHCLLAAPGTQIEELREVHSHIHALPQCALLIRKLGLKSIVHADTAGAAQEVAAAGPGSGKAAIASALAADIYDLEILKSNVEDASHNTTRFLILSRDADLPDFEAGQMYLTSFIFRVRNIPAALYKALGGFATNGVNMTKLESYVDEKFQAAQFYADVEGHPDEKGLSLALEELGFFATDIVMLGTYPAHPFRKSLERTKI